MLGDPKPPSLKDSRRGTLIGVVALLTIVAVAFVFEISSLLYGAITLAGLTSMHAVRWRKLHLAQRDRQ